MRKVVIEKAGSYDRLQIKSCAEPSLKRGEVLVEVKACGVKLADCLVRMGLYQSAKEFVGWPITPGFEFSGIVKKVGEGASEFELGQAVMGTTLFGAYSLILPCLWISYFRCPVLLALRMCACPSRRFLDSLLCPFRTGPSQKGRKRPDPFCGRRRWGCACAIGRFWPAVSP